MDKVVDQRVDPKAYQADYYFQRKKRAGRLALIVQAELVEKPYWPRFVKIRRLVRARYYRRWLHLKALTKDSKKGSLLVTLD